MSVKLDSRWSKRGIKKCSSCGTYNGHRAVRCKNKLCGQILNSHQTGTAQSASVVQIVPFPIANEFQGVRLRSSIQGQSATLYSVRKTDGDVRGFVEIRDCVDGADDLEFKTGICYVDCEPHTDLDGTCQHVRVAEATTEVAETLVIQREMLERLRISSAVKEEIWKRQESCTDEDPLVQKISSDIFVVRCEEVMHHLVPYCHVQLKLPSSILCDCPETFTSQQKETCHHSQVVAAAVLSSPLYGAIFENMLKHLLNPPEINSNHLSDGTLNLDNLVLLQNEPADGIPFMENTDQLLVATIQDPSAMAESSDLQLITYKLEFDPELEPTKPTSTVDDSPLSPVIELINSTENSLPVSEAFATSYDDTLQLMDCQIELMDQFNLTDQIDFCPSDIELSDDNVVFPADEELGLAVQPEDQPITEATSSSKQEPKRKLKLVDVTTKKAALRQSSKQVAKQKLLRKGSYNVRRLMKALESNGIVFNRLSRSEAVAMAAAGSDGVGTELPLASGGSSLPSYEATLCNLSFTSWLESVIEQLNSVIQYGDNGKPAPQVFSIHENFFQCLRARFSVGHTLRTPDHTVPLEEDGPRKGLTCQLYKFSCYKSLRNVLKTDKIALQFEKSFCRTAGGSYEEIDLSSSVGQVSSNEKQHIAIKPFQYKTYIKMGTYRSDPSNKTHYFIVEWTGGVLPKCRFGELRMIFEYGHKENNSYVESPAVVGSGLVREENQEISASNGEHS